MKTFEKTILLSLSLAGILPGGAAHSAPAIDKPEHKEWSLSLQFGVHRPQLQDLYQGLFKNPVSGYNERIVDETTGDKQMEPFSFDAPLPAVPNGPKGIIELHWHPGSRHSLVFGVGSWETHSTTTTGGTLYTQGRINEDVHLRRNASLSYTEYHLGWRYEAIKLRKFSLFGGLSAQEFFDIDLREERIFTFHEGGSTAGFPRIEVAPSQTASLMMLSFSTGAEWRFQPWFSMDIELGYFLGLGQAKLRYDKILFDFQANDGVQLSRVQLPDGTLAYNSPGSSPESPEIREMLLDFSGWQVMLRMKFDY